LKNGALPAEAFDRSYTNRLGTGSLSSMDSQIDTSTGTLKLKAEFPNQQQNLFANQFVNVRVLAEILHDQVLIPVPAIQRSSQGSFVYVVKPDKTVEIRKVQVGLIEGDTAAVQSGLASGETVVTTGVDRLQAGSRVTLQAPPVSKPLAINAAQ
jgi:multidrug efflux system membrane fusion protein